jgi:hypothetical protein
MKLRPRKTGYPAKATRDELCQRVKLAVPTSVRLRLEALEVARREGGGAEKADPPSANQLEKDEREYLGAIRRRCFQGSRPEPGSIGAAPYYLQLADATSYLEQRLAMHREERARIAQLEATGDHVQPPAAVVAGCIREGLSLPGAQGMADDYIQASVPLSLLRAAGLREGGRDVAGLVQALPALVAPYGLTDEEVGALVATVAALDALPPPPRAVVETLSRAVVAGLVVVERLDRERAGRGGLASRLPGPEVWRNSTWERLRAMGREVPPLPYR